MPIGIDAIVEPVIDTTSYVWGQKDGRFRRFQANAFQGAAGANGTNGTNGASGYTVTDNTAASSDLLLAAGDVAYIDYTSATSVPLYIQTEEGLYELDVQSAVAATFNGGSLSLTPNSGGLTAGSVDNFYTYTDITQSEGSGGKTASAYKVEDNVFRIAERVPMQVTGKISTKTACKSYVGQSISFVASGTYEMSNYFCMWADTSAAWTSLGTLTFQQAQSGKIIIRRII